MDDWKSLTQENHRKHEQHLVKVKNVPSYSINLQKYAPPDEDGDETAANDDDGAE